MRETLNLAYASVTQDVNGPGRRYTVWAQGCFQGCPGCFNPQLQPRAACRELRPEKLAEEAARARPWDGVTLSGGEPFLQGGALSEFLDALRRLVGAFSTIAFTGYRFGELQRRGGSAAALLDRVDLLVDGPYREARSSQLPLRGSANQRLIALTAVGASLRERVERDPPPGCEVQIGEGGEVILSGFPPVDLIRRVRELLAESTSPTSAEGRR